MNKAHSWDITVQSTKSLIRKTKKKQGLRNDDDNNGTGTMTFPLSVFRDESAYYCEYHTEDVW